MFNEEAERIIGCSADELDKLKSQVHSLYKSERDFKLRYGKVETDFNFLYFLSLGGRGELV